MKNIGLLITTLITTLISFTLGCSSAKVEREREMAREEASKKTGFYCNYIKENGEMSATLKDLVIQVAERCSIEHPLSLTQYTVNTDDKGVLYCCSKPPKVETPVDSTPKPQALPVHNENLLNDPELDQPTKTAPKTAPQKTAPTKAAPKKSANPAPTSAKNATPSGSASAAKAKTAPSSSTGGTPSAGSANQTPAQPTTKPAGANSPATGTESTGSLNKPSWSNTGSPNP